MSAVKARKKPVEVEVFLFQGTAESGEKIIEWAKSFGATREVIIEDDPLFGCDLVIETLEGFMKASPGDYIIRGVNDELYPCKPDIFERTYEFV